MQWDKTHMQYRSLLLLRKTKANTQIKEIMETKDRTIVNYWMLSNKQIGNVFYKLQNKVIQLSI